MAAMLRGDLAAARQQWLDEVKHDAEARARERAGYRFPGQEPRWEVLDFLPAPYLRLVAGPARRSPDVIKNIMRHSTITLTLDTYGHLLPDQHADAIGGIGQHDDESTAGGNGDHRRDSGRAQ